MIPYLVCTRKKMTFRNIRGAVVLCDHVLASYVILVKHLNLCVFMLVQNQDLQIRGTIHQHGNVINSYNNSYLTKKAAITL